MKTISVQELQNKIEANETVKLYDVRSHGEFNAVHASEAQNIPLDGLSKEKADSIKQDEDIYFICQSGKRSSMACMKMESYGVKNVISVEGGTSAWEDAGFPVIKGKGTISIERQVRIAAGALVATGSILSLAINTNFIALPIFVGCGLIFAGITDTCGMGMLLSKMPWNR